MLGLFLALLTAAAPARIAPPASQVEYKQPQLAVSGNTVAVAFGAGNTVYFAVSRDGGRRFAKPVTVAEGENLALGRHRGPRIAFASGAVVISAIEGEKFNGNLVAWRSTDGGETWSKGVVINDVPSSAREGLQGMAAGPKGLLFAAWLDSRNKHNQVYGAVSHDSGATWSKNVVVYASPDGHTCECCHPSVAIDEHGRIYVMWRNWLGGSRDLYLARSDDGMKFSAGEKLGKGTWPLNACPMDGGGLSVSDKGAVTTVWRRESGIYLDRPGQPEQKLGTGKDPSVAAGYVAWSTPSGLVLKKPGSLQPAPLASGAYVNLAGAGPIYAAWEDRGSVYVERVSP